MHNENGFIFALCIYYRSDVIIVDDEDSPINAQQQLGGAGNSAQSAADFHALKELLDQEEKKLNMLKSKRVRQTSPINNSSATAVSTRAGNGPTIQGSALNKASGRASGSATLRESPIPFSSKSTNQSKPSIVVVPGKSSARGGGGGSTGTLTVASRGSGGGAAVPSTGISSRLQQIVDTVAVDQALGSISSASAHNALRSLNSSAQVKLLGSMQTPPVPSLITTSNSSQKLSNGTPFHQFSSSNMPPLRPKLPSGSRSSHEIITIGDSPVTKNPPPLLPTPSTGLTGLPSHVRIPTATATGSIQVPAISSTSRALSAIANTSAGHGLDTMEAIENSKRYKEYRMKQLHSKKTFQKQIERRMISSPYPKTFRQVWPVVPIQDPAFVRNFGLESVLHHFDSSLKALHEKSNNASKVKPICNQCGCDFASAWQIRKNNSKQLLLCEACDFQNLKILQRTKLSNQLKDLLESVEKEEEKFSQQCEEALKQVIALEKQSVLTSQANRPPPLTSNLQAKQQQLSGDLSNHTVVRIPDLSGGHTTSARLASIIGGGVGGGSVLMKGATYGTGKKSQAHEIQPRAVIPSIIGQISHNGGAGGGGVGGESSRKRKDPPSLGGREPASKTFKAGSVLDQTLSKISQHLIHRKLDEQRQELVGESFVIGGGGGDRGRENMDHRGNASPSPSPSPAGAPPTTGRPTPSSAKSRREGRKSRRKGTPRHKRHLSSSSVTSD